MLYCSPIASPEAAEDEMLDALDYLIGLVQDGASLTRALTVVREELGIEDARTLRAMFADVAPIYGLSA